MLCGMELNDLARLVRQRRLARKWSVEEGARQAGINRVTWKRIEDGLPVQDAKRHAVEELFGIADPDVTPELASSALRILRDQLNRDLLRFTDYELITELHVRMVLMASRLHALGDDTLTFVVDPESGDNVATSRPSLGESS